VFGAYQIDINGSVSGPPARAGLFQRIGRFEFDGSGNFTATSLANYAGNLASENFEGTYSVDDNCFFTVQYTFSGEDITLWGALGGDGQSGAIMVASPGWAVSGLLRAQQQ
jgi:hypothetical protein